MESEIFGHESGAFTGAAERRIGCFELADGGTLLLDEIGEMPAPTQAKLLRVLEDHKVRRLGSKMRNAGRRPRDRRDKQRSASKPSPKDNLRQDLFFRLNVFHIHLPPLREHKDDLPSLVESLLRDINQKHGQPSHRRRHRSDGAFQILSVARKYSRAAQCSRTLRHRRRSRADRPPASSL